MEVEIKDRKEEVEFLRMACNMTELGISYLQADLILRIQETLKKKKGSFSLTDGIEIGYKWKEGWRKYFEQQSKKEKPND
jgi:hypothetical protein